MSFENNNPADRKRYFLFPFIFLHKCLKCLYLKMFFLVMCFEVFTSTSLMYILAGMFYKLIPRSLVPKPKLIRRKT